MNVDNNHWGETGNNGTSIGDAATLDWMWKTSGISNAGPTQCKASNIFMKPSTCDTYQPQPSGNIYTAVFHCIIYSNNFKLSSYCLTLRSPRDCQLNMSLTVCSLTLRVEGFPWKWRVRDIVSISIFSLISENSGSFFRRDYFWLR